MLLSLFLAKEKHMTPEPRFSERDHSQATISDELLEQM